MRVARLPLLLLLVAVFCALGVVTSQHKARKLFTELQKEKDEAQRMEVEWGQLQLEQSTWATPVRVEKIAASKLQMQLPKSGQIQFIRVEQPSPQSSGGATSHSTKPASGQVAGYPASGKGGNRAFSSWEKGEKGIDGANQQP